MYDELGINYGYGKIREKVNRIKTLKDKDQTVTITPPPDIPKTGDTTNIPLWGALTGISLLGAGVVAFFTFRKKKEENVQNYALSQTLGGVTLTAEEAYELLSMSPEQVKERVKTAGDLLMYMLAAKIGDLGGDREKNIDGVTWHYNISAKQVLYGPVGLRL